MNLPFQSKLIMKLAFFIVFITLLFVCVEKIKVCFPIKSVKVFGTQYIDPRATREALTPLVKKGFFAIDVEVIKDRLMQSPWVSEAIVQRVWPDQVIVKIIEKKPMARWNRSGLLSTNGEIFSPDIKSYPNDIPQFVGLDSQHLEMLKYYKKITALLAPLRFKIIRLELTSSAAWLLTFDNGIKLSANHENILTHMSHFVKVYPHIVGSRLAEVEYIDLRYQNGLAVRWKTIT